MKSVLSIDWLSYFGSYRAIKPISPIELKLRDYGTKVFRVCADVYLSGRVVGVLSYAPRSGVLREDMAVFKFENSVLYEHDFSALRTQILHCLRFKVEGFNRLDLALDFNYFQIGIDGHAFIKGFLQERYLHNGRGKFSVQGVQKFENSYEYLRLGSKSSPVLAYLYNKSQEMLDVKEKPYIRERWNQAGLRSDCSVWRLEFSLKSDFFSMIDKNSGAFPLSFDFDFCDFSQLKELYQSLYNKYFDFRFNDKKANKSRMQRVDLISLSSVFSKFSRIYARTQSSRREKIFLHYLHKYPQRVGFSSIQSGFELEYAKEEFIKRTGLESYYLHKKNAWDLSE